VEDPAFKLADLLALELHKFEDEVSEIVDRAQKEEKMEVGLKKLEDTWTKVSFQFTKHKDTDVSTVKMAEEDFEVGALSVQQDWQNMRPSTASQPP
jgi:dynein heavy chain